jgi:hypothetical protein
VVGSLEDGVTMTVYRYPDGSSVSKVDSAIIDLIYTKGTVPGVIPLHDAVITSLRLRLKNYIDRNDLYVRVAASNDIAIFASLMGKNDKARELVAKLLTKDHPSNLLARYVRSLSAVKFSSAPDLDTLLSIMQDALRFSQYSEEMLSDMDPRPKCNENLSFFKSILDKYDLNNLWSEETP